MRLANRFGISSLLKCEYRLIDWRSEFDLIYMSELDLFNNGLPNILLIILEGIIFHMDSKFLK